MAILNKNKTFLIHLGILFGAILLIYWPVSFFQHSLKWDTTDGYLPFRYFLSECLRNGEWPLWQPYTSCGYPFHGDPQSAAWYLPAWLISLGIGYNMTAMELEFIFTLFIAGAGMYLLAKTIVIDPSISVCIAIAYVGCGFFVGNAQHFTWVISGAYLPWIVATYYRMQTTKKYGYALLCAFFLWLLITGGYPAFLLTIAYVLIGFFLVETVHYIRTKNYQALGLQLKLNAVLATVFLVLSAVMIFSIIHVHGLINRGTGLTLEAIQASPFTLKSCISFLTPFAVLQKPEFFGADISMNNAYIGLLALLFFGLGLFSIKTSTEKIVFGITVLFFLIALGDLTPLRAYLYQFLPGMDLFRFPALFRIFFIIPLLLLAGLSVSRFQKDQMAYQMPIRRIAIAIGIMLVAVFSVAIFKNRQALQLSSLFTAYESYVGNSSISRLIIVQAGVQLILFTILLVLLLGKRRFNYTLLIAFMITDMGIAAYLNHFTLVYHFPTKDVDAKFKDFPQGFPAPQGFVGYNTDYGRGYLWPILRNTGFYYKLVSIDGYNSFKLRSFQKLDVHAQLKQQALNHPLFYFCNRVQSFKDTALNFAIDDRTVFLEDSCYLLLKNKRLKHTQGDSVRCVELRPNFIKAHTATAAPQLLNLLQNEADGWEVTIDGQKQSYFKTNYTFMAIVLPAGKHEVIWRYHPTAIYIGMYITLTGLLILVIYTCFFWHKLI